MVERAFGKCEERNLLPTRMQPASVRSRRKHEAGSALLNGHRKCEVACAPYVTRALGSFVRGGTLCCIIGTVRRARSSCGAHAARARPPPLFGERCIAARHRLLQSSLPVRHGACVVDYANAVRQCVGPTAQRCINSMEEAPYAMDDSELHRYAFWFRNHDVYRYALKPAWAA
jgi:hypothetical protein